MKVTVLMENTAPEGYELHVQVLSQAIQATPAEAITNSWAAVSGIGTDGVLQITQ